MSLTTADEECSLTKRPGRAEPFLRALRLKERLARRGATDSGCQSCDADDAGSIRWENMAPRLVDLDEHALLRCYGVASLEELRKEIERAAADTRGEAPDVPGWACALSETLSGDLQEGDEDPIPARRGRNLEAWTVVYAPLLNREYRRLRQWLAERLASCEPGLLCTESVLTKLYAQLLDRVASAIGYTLTLELNVARVRDELKGDTPEERFQSFAASLKEGGRRQALNEEYPVLARIVQRLCCQWREVCAEVLDRFLHDSQDGCGAPLLPVASALVDVKFDAGDRHCDGRSVCILHFESGRKLVYKPRSLSMDEKWNRLLDWVNRHCDIPPLYLPVIVDRGTHGWAEFLESQSCESEEEAKRFYTRHGALLALVHAFCGVDFHSENVIARGEFPVLVDLEALMQPRGHKPLQQVPVENFMNDSVTQTGLLPEANWAKDQTPYDVSGLGSVVEQLTPYTVPVFDNFGTDCMKVVRRSVRVRRDKHLPMFNGAPAAPVNYADQYVEGFERVYRLLMANREELIGSQGLLADFATENVRIVVRPTRTYQRLLDQSTHPDFLRDGRDQDLAFSTLAKCCDFRPLLKEVLDAEHQEMINNRSVPIFWARADEVDLLAVGGRVVRNYFSMSGIERVRQRLQSFSEEDLQRQAWIIRTSIMLTAREVRPPIHTSRYRYETQPRPLTKQEALDTAVRMADRLIGMAFQQGGVLYWAGLRHHNGSQWALLPLRSDLYDGLCGLVLYLAYLGAITGESRFRRLAERQLDLVLTRMQVGRDDGEIDFGLGLFSTGGGYIYTLAHCAHLWKRPDLMAEVEASLPIIRDGIDADDTIDVIGGSAGLVLALRSAYAVEKRPSFLTCIERAAERIINQAIPYGTGVVWQTSMPASKPLTGFSHGNSGIVCGLVAAADLLGSDRYLETAKLALEYERSTYSPEHRNWPDFRLLTRTPEAEENDGTPTYPVTWCHGAPGIALSRALVIPALGATPTLLDELSIALTTTLTYGFGRSHCLCHGDLGCEDVFLKVSELPGMEGRRVVAYDAAQLTLSRIRTDGTQCGTPWWLDTPGLMMGLAGVGYGFLRLAAPDVVPSVLAADEPAIAAG